MPAQQIELSYGISEGVNAQPDTVKLYLRSTDNRSFGLRALNTSILFSGDKTNFMGFSSLLAQKWSPTFQRDRTDTTQTYHWGNRYTHRWNYAIGDAYVNASSLLEVPPDTLPAIKVMEVFFRNLGAAKIYVENQTENPVNQLGDTTFRAVTFTVRPLPGTFPVTWAYFQGDVLPSNETRLSWGTLSEVNNDRFEIEKSETGQLGSFFIIGEIAGKSNTTDPVDYRFVDPTLGEGNTYYRLRQVDVDGDFTLSNTLAVYRDGNRLRLRIGPSPARQKATAYVGVPLNEPYTLEVRDLQGRLIWTYTADQPTEQEDKIALPVLKWEEGLYMVRLAAMWQGVPAVQEEVLRVY